MYVCVCVCAQKSERERGILWGGLVFASLFFHRFLQQVSQSISQDCNIFLLSHSPTQSFSYSPCLLLLPLSILLCGGWAVFLSICCVPKGRLGLLFRQTYILRSLAIYFTLTLGFMLFNSCCRFGNAYCCLFLALTSSLLVMLRLNPLPVYGIVNYCCKILGPQFVEHVHYNTTIKWFFFL